MLTIKLKRIGKKHQAAYRLVVSERRSKLKGDYTEDLGWYNPHSKKNEFNLDRINYWLGVGAKPSDTIHNLFLAKGVIKEGKKIAVHKQPKKTEEKSKAPAAESPVKEAVAEEKKA